MRFFKTTPQAGKPLALKGFAKGIAAIARAIEGMSVHNGHVEWHAGRPKIIVDIADSGGGAGAAYPFLVTQVDDFTINIEAGRWVRNGETTAYAGASGLQPGFSLGTNYIVATLTAAGGQDPGTRPAAVGVGNIAQASFQETEFNKEKLIAEIEADSSGRIIPPIIQRWKGGDIDDTTMVPDSETSAAVGSKSIEIIDSGVHEGLSAVYGFHDLTTVNSDYGKMPYNVITAGVPTVTWDHTIKYNGNGIINGTQGDSQEIECIKDFSAQATGNQIDFGSTVRTITDGREDVTDPGPGGSIVFIVDFASGNFANEINWASFGGTGFMSWHHDECDPASGADPYLQDTWNGNTDHDRRYMYVHGSYNSGDGTGVNTADFHTSGQLHGEVLAITSDPAGNFWRVSAFNADIAGAFNAQASGVLGIRGAPLDITTSAGDVTITPTAGNLNLAAGVYEIGGVEGQNVLDGVTPVITGGITVLSGITVETYRLVPEGGGPPVNKKLLVIP